jgi:subtilisin family serine protease
VVGPDDSEDVVLAWSPTASGVSIYAPGLQLKGPIGGSGASAGSYGYWDGTSFSAAFVSGVAALVKEASPGVTSVQMRVLLKYAYAPATGCAQSALGQVDAELATD